MVDINFACRSCEGDVSSYRAITSSVIDARSPILTDTFNAMSTQPTRLTAPRGPVSPTPVGQTGTPAPLVPGGATQRALTGPMIGLRAMGAPSKKWGSGSFGIRKTAADVTQKANRSVEPLNDLQSIPTGYALPPGVGRPSAPNEAQVPQPQNRPPQMPVPPDRPMQHPMLAYGQSTLQHLWHSLTKIGENMASLIQAIARAMGNLHH